MSRPQHPVLDRQGALIKGLCFGSLPLSMVQLRQAVESRGHIGVVCPLYLLLNGKEALIEGFCLAKLLLVVIEICETFEGDNEARVIRRKTLCILQGSFPQCLGFTVLALLKGFRCFRTCFSPARSRIG